MNLRTTCSMRELHLNNRLTLPVRCYQLNHHRMCPVDMHAACLWGAQALRPCSLRRCQKAHVSFLACPDAAIMMHCCGVLLACPAFHSTTISRALLQYTTAAHGVAGTCKISAPSGRYGQSCGFTLAYRSPLVTSWRCVLSHVMPVPHPVPHHALAAVQLRRRLAHLRRLQISTSHVQWSHSTRPVDILLRIRLSESMYTLLYCTNISLSLVKTDYMPRTTTSDLTDSVLLFRWLIHLQD